jgi:phosphoribosylanthranilate isomerase
MAMFVKYCGCRTEDDYRLLSSSKADIIGFVFADSKRKVTPEEVSAWVASLGKHKQLAGVFQNHSIEEIVSAAMQVPLDIIQCHGNESVQTIKELKEQTKKQVFKALPYSKAIDEQMALYADCADAILVDSVSKGQFGGTGVSFDWSEVPALLSAAEQYGISVFIAGGIKPDNISALLPYKPYGIDLSGGIEHEGKKCKEQITEIERKISYVSSNRT